MDDFLEKPIRLDALEEALRRAPKPSQAGRAAREGEIPNAFAVVDPLALESLRQLGGENGEVLVRELVERFLEDGAAAADVIRRAGQEGDVGALERAVHLLRGSASHFGAQALMHRCLAVEERCEDGLTVSVAQEAEQVCEEFERLRLRLHKEIGHARGTIGQAHENFGGRRRRGIGENPSAQLGA
jgi:HPt (histidine-containing phosphotransfer) domain-containing protein